MARKTDRRTKQMPEHTDIKPLREMKKSKTVVKLTDEQTDKKRQMDKETNRQTDRFKKDEKT